MKSLMGVFRFTKFELVIVGLAAVCFFSLPAWSQVPIQPLGQPAGTPAVPLPQPAGASSNPVTQAIDVPRGGDLVLGPGDIVDIQITDAPDLSGKYLVSDAGQIRIPTVANPMNVTGLTTTQLSSVVAVALKDAQQLQNPIVSVFVQEYHSHTVTVLGAVAKPGQYPVEVKTSLLQAISEAGGLGANAGSVVTITDPATTGSSKGTAERAAATTKMVNIGQITAANSAALTTYVHAGEVITVSTAAVVYVVGGVTRPGAFALQPDKEVTLLQALSLVGGFAPSASPKRAVIVRRPSDPKGREEIPVDLNKILAGKAPDSTLEANDILFIPVSGLKKGLHRMGDSAVTAATDIAGFGLIYGAF